MVTRATLDSNVYVSALVFGGKPESERFRVWRSPLRSPLSRRYVP